jgi:hypothetical protein
VGKEHLEERDEFIRNVLTRLYGCPGNRAKAKYELRENVLAESHFLLLAGESIH